jgi:hypothetical protein
MGSHTLQFRAGSRVHRSLASRGGLLRTFGGVALVIAVTLFAVGLYLIQDTVADPQASQANLFVAAFLLANGVVLLYYLIYPSKYFRQVTSRRARTRD